MNNKRERESNIKEFRAISKSLEQYQRV